MIIRYLLILLLFFTVSLTSKVFIEPEFRVFVNRFEKLIGTKIFKVPMHFTFDTISNDKIIAACIYYEGITAIVIDKVWWVNSNELQREQVLFHEMGHCILGKNYGGSDDQGHINGAIKAFNNKSGCSGICPKSIMKSIAFTKEELRCCYESYYSYYIDELMGTNYNTKWKIPKWEETFKIRSKK